MYRKATYLDSSYQGCWICFVLPNQDVEQGQLLGEFHDIFGRKLGEVISPVSGRVLYQKATLVVNEGELLIALAHQPDETMLNIW